MSVPADLLARMGAIFARMSARGMTEQMQIYARVTQTDSSGNPIARPRELVGAITVHVTAGGGAEQQAQEGMRTSNIDQIYYANDGSGILTDANYTERWIILPTRNNAFRRVVFCKVIGPYYWAQTEEGGTTDAAGNMK